MAQPLKTPIHRRYPGLRSRQQGVTLLELMVGLTIGLLVVLAAVASIAFTRASARAVSDAAALEQRGSLLMMQIGQQLKQAGAINAVISDPGSGKVVFDTSYRGVVDGSSTAVQISGADGASGAPDTFIISYAPPNDGSVARNCRAQNAMTYPPAPAVGSPQVVNVFDVANEQLRCGTGGAQQQPIAEGVRDLQVFYLRRTGANADIVRQTATELGASAADWAAVDAVEVCLHMVGDRVQAPAVTLNDCSDSAQNFDDGRVHRFIRQVYYLRNKSRI